MRTIHSISLLALSTLFAACSAAPDGAVAGHSTAPASSGSGATPLASGPSAASGLSVAGHPVAAAPAKPSYARAAVDVPAGSHCSLHPAGDLDPKEAIDVQADADGVARFYAVRPSQPGDVDLLALDCTKADGSAHTYPVDLRADATFADRPFDNGRAKLDVRPALAGDPLSYSVEELIARGYGLRPDPAQTPEKYALWLAAAMKPMRIHRTAMRSMPLGRQQSHPTPGPTRALQTGDEERFHALVSQTGTTYCANVPNVTPAPGCYWTGPILSGSYKAGTATAAEQGYLEASADVTVPSVTPGAFSTGNTMMSMWTGLDNVFQAIVWVQTTSKTASVHLDTQYHTPGVVTFASRESPAFTPAWGDQVLTQEWYCDSTGKQTFTGGYGCTHMADIQSGDVWDCSTATSSSCASYGLTSGVAVGTRAEFIVENDSPQDGSTWNWPDFGQATMTSATATLSQGGTVSPATDPSVVIALDPNPSGESVHVEASLVAEASAAYGAYSPDLPPSVNWTVTTGAIPAPPKAPGCTYTGQPGLLGVRCAGGNAGDQISVFQLNPGGYDGYSGNWEYYFEPIPAGQTENLGATESMTVLACSANAGWGWWTNAQGGSLDVAPVGPGLVGCDAVATNVCIPQSCTAAQCGTTITNSCGGTTECPACPVCKPTGAACEGRCGVTVSNGCGGIWYCGTCGGGGLKCSPPSYKCGDVCC